MPLNKNPMQLIYSTLLLIIFFIFLPAAYAEEFIKVNIKQSSRHSFITVSIINNSNTDIFIHENSLCASGILTSSSFTIRDFDGRVIPYKWLTTSVNSEHSNIFVLQGYGKTIRCEVHLPSFYDFKATGIYKVQFHLQIPDHKMQKGREVKSNSLNFKFNYMN